MSAAPTALVTGASGFVGRHVVQALLDAGWSVRALVHRTPLAQPIASRADAVAGDLGDLAPWARRLEGARAVVHCGALLDPVRSAHEADAINHRATVALARAAAHAGVADFAFVSSIAAVGFSARAGLLSPSAACRPTSDYGRSKRAAEQALSSLELGMRTVILRPPTVYGPGETRNFLSLTRAIAGRVFPIPGDGSNRMSFCHATNLAAAVTWALQTSTATGIVHVADARPVTLDEAVRTIADALGASAATRVVHVPLPAMRVAATAAELLFAVAGRRAPLDRARLRTITADCALDTSETAALGFVPPVGFEDGVVEAVRWYRAAGLL